VTLTQEQIAEIEALVRTTPTISDAPTTPEHEQ